MTAYNVWVALKATQDKSYGNLQSLLVFTYYWKNLLIDFITKLLILIDSRRDSYDLILVIVNRLTKMVSYKQVKVIINTLGFAEIIINIIVRHHGLLDLIVIDWELLFNSNFWPLLCYFIGIKQKLSTAFHPQINGQIGR